MKHAPLFLGFLLTTFLGSAHAVEFKNFKLEQIRSASLFVMAKGCTQTIERPYWFDKTEKVDCYGIRLEDASGKDLLGNTVVIPNLVFAPASIERSDAEKALNYILGFLRVNGKTLPQGVTIDASEVRYIDKDFPYSTLTSDESNTQMVKLGGMSLAVHTHIQNGSVTYNGNSRISMGIE